VTRLVKRLALIALMGFLGVSEVFGGSKLLPEIAAFHRRMLRIARKRRPLDIFQDATRAKFPFAQLELNCRLRGYDFHVEETPKDVLNLVVSYYLTTKKTYLPADRTGDAERVLGVVLQVAARGDDSSGWLGESLRAKRVLERLGGFPKR